jgi:hypothetical protein
MNTAVLILCKILDKTLNIVIILAAFFEAYLLIISWNKLATYRTKIKKLNNYTKLKITSGEHKEKGVVKTVYTSTSEKNWREFDMFCSNYQEDGKVFSLYSLLIQIFTLLGILGTVAGLFIAMQNNKDWSNSAGMFEGVKFALSSTVLGIIFAVIFKIFDIFLNAFYINYIDDGIARFTANYSEEKDDVKFFESQNKASEKKAVPKESAGYVKDESPADTKEEAPNTGNQTETDSIDEEVEDALLKLVKADKE